MSFCVGLFSLTLIGGVVLASNSVLATDDEVVDSVQLTVPIACTMTGTGTTHTATLNPGTYSGESGSEYENGIGKTTLTAICNDDNGFSIYAIGFTENKYDGENHTKLIGANTGGVIATKAYASGDTTSNWSMKLTKVTNPVSGDPVTYNPDNLTITTDYDTWHAVPDTFAKVAEYHANTGSSTTDTTLGVKLETTYAAYIATNQPADIYEGQVKYTMVHPYNDVPAQPQTSASGKICYYANASNAEGTMGCQNVASNVTLLASNFSRTGYGFAGWSDKFDYATNNEAHFYGPQEDLSIPDTSIYTGEGKGLSLYAVWIKSAGNLQDTSKVAQLCGTGTGSLTTAVYDNMGDEDESTWSITAGLSSVSALTDQRDNETYAIAKLADGECWMIENLRLDNTATLTLANTNNPLNDGANVTLKHSYTDTNTFNTLSASSDVAYNADTTPDGWCTTSSAACNDQSRLRTDNTADRAINSPNANSNSMYSYGNYYNWYSATAGRGTTAKSSGTTEGDLCPTGWHLPYGNSSTGTMGGNTAGGFYYLASSMVATASNAINSKKHRTFPNNYLYSSYVIGESLNGRGVYGVYWSSTAGNGSYAYDLYLSGSRLTPGTELGGYKYYGRTVRCVAQ